jgi:transcriptional regulator with XRE-family HTH domain
MFYQRLHEICKEKNTSVTKMVKELGLSTGNMSNWKQGRLPKTEIAFKIANYLNVSVGYLMGEEEQKNPLPDNEERIKELYELTEGLTPEDINMLRAFAAGLKANRKSD